jgi:hypothetical protein
MKIEKRGRIEGRLLLAVRGGNVIIGQELEQKNERDFSHNDTTEPPA